MDATKFTPKLTSNWDNGWRTVVLLLANDTASPVWVEGAVVVLSDLETSWQTSIPAERTKHEIRQNVQAEQFLEVSLAQAVYDAAGKPQGWYSCRISVNVRYRVGEEWFEKALDTVQLEMEALRLLSLRQSR